MPELTNTEKLEVIKILANISEADEITIDVQKASNEKLIELIKSIKI